jgi:hypothetical protein
LSGAVHLIEREGQMVEAKLGPPAGKIGIRGERPRQPAGQWLPERGAQRGEITAGRRRLAIERDLAVGRHEEVAGELDTGPGGRQRERKAERHAFGNAIDVELEIKPLAARHHAPGRVCGAGKILRRGLEIEFVDTFLDAAGAIEDGAIGNGDPADRDGRCSVLRRVLPLRRRRRRRFARRRLRETPIRAAVSQALEIEDGVDQGQAAQHELSGEQRHQRQPGIDARRTQHVGHGSARGVGEADVFGDQTGIGQQREDERPGDRDLPSREATQLQSYRVAIPARIDETRRKEQPGRGQDEKRDAEDQDPTQAAPVPASSLPSTARTLHATGNALN